MSTKAILDKTTNKCKGAQCVLFFLRSLFLTRRHSRTERAEKKCELAHSRAVTQQLCSCLGVIRPGQETDSQAVRRCLPAPCYFKPPSSVTAVGVSAKEVAPTPPPSCLTDSAALCPGSCCFLFFFRSLVSPSGMVLCGAGGD